MVKNKKINSIDFFGGTLCLDFVNSVHTRREDPPPSYLENIQDLLAWSERLQIIDARTANVLDTFAEAHPKKAEQFFKEAMELRELLYSIFYTISTGKKISPADLEAFNRWLAQCFGAIRLVQQN